ncbi:hypothetical protein Tco_1212128 [Tanacetum coccineum]
MSASASVKWRIQSGEGSGEWLRCRGERSGEATSDWRRKKITTPHALSTSSVSKADDQEIESVKDEEGKNVEDQQVSEADNDTSNDNVGYMRQPVEDEAWFPHEIDHPNDNENKADHENNKSTQENVPEKK